MKHSLPILSTVKATILISLILMSTSCTLFKKSETITDRPVSEKSSAIYQNGLVVSANSIASEVGLQVMKKGGNAIDAAVAVQFALAVVYPGAGNIGGGGFMVYRSAKGETAALDFRETAPLNATKDMYLDMYGQPIAGLSLQGRLASGVPGSVDGMVKAHERYGRLGWKELIQHAIDLARHGFTVTAAQARELNSKAESFLEYNREVV